jgi:predicted ATP-dependent serine protease
MNNTCAICGESTDPPEFWGRVTCHDCGSQPVAFEASCDTCGWSTTVKDSERARGRAKQAAQREANTHETTETLSDRGPDDHSTAVREIDAVTNGDRS